jgi:DNA-binding transcriptional MerR regulator
MGKAYRIGGVAGEAGVTIDTLRYYEKLGVLPRARRTSGGLRQYGEDVLKQVRFIQQAQALGLTLSDVRQLVGDQGRVGRDHEPRSSSTLRETAGRRTSKGISSSTAPGACQRSMI